MPLLTMPTFRAVLSVAALAATASAQAEQIIGLTSNALITFDSATPGSTSAPIAITGLASGSTLLDINLRPRTALPTTERSTP